MNDTNLNHKLRSDSVFAQLTAEQIEMLEDWLFEEKLSYKEVIEKLQQEFGVKTSQTALGRFYRRLAEKRTQEWRIETIAQCLETLATAKGDGTLQAGLFAMANMHAMRLMTEEKPSFREITAWLRAMTSAGAFEMKRVEVYESKEKERLAEIERKEKEAKEKEDRARWNAEYNARYEAREAKRKATIAAKKAKAEAEALAVSEAEAAKEISSSPNSGVEGYSHPSPSIPLPVEGRGKEPAQSVSEPQAALSEQPNGEKSNETPTAEVLDELAQIEKFGYVAINWAGNPR